MMVSEYWNDFRQILTILERKAQYITKSLIKLAVLLTDVSQDKELFLHPVFSC